MIYHKMIELDTMLTMGYKMIQFDRAQNNTVQYSMTRNYTLKNVLHKGGKGYCSQ